MSNEAGFFKGSNDTFEIGLNIYQIGVYTYLTRCANNKKSAFPSYSTIADKCGISKRKAITTVAELEGLGLVKKDIRYGEGRNQTNTYKVIFAQKGAHDAPLKVHDMHHHSAHDAPNKELNYKELEEKELSHTFLPKSAHVFIEIYIKHFERRKRKKHPKVTYEKVQHVLNQIEYLESFDVLDGEWEEKVIEHFDNLPDKNNGNILAFIEASQRHFEIPMYNHIPKFQR